MKKLMVMAGGTGGHVFPALAVAEHLRSQDVEIVWLGTRAGLEARVVPENGFNIHWMSISGLRGKGIRRKLAMPFILLRALFQGLVIMLKEKPDALLGMGGFAAGPGAVSGRILGRSLLIHEANASAGLTNRLLAPLAKVVMTGFPRSEGLPARSLYTGNPVRSQIAQQPAAGETNDPLRLLIVGGSLGAEVFNTRLPSILTPLIESGRLQVRHQCGRDRHDAVLARYGDLGSRVQVDEFINNMGNAYADADLVICRAGAMTVAELAMAAKPAILVPFPFAAGDHQTSNARFLSDQGAAILMPQDRLDENHLLTTLNELLGNPERLNNMSSNAAALARPDATEQVANACLEVMYA